MSKGTYLGLSNGDGYELYLFKTKKSMQIYRKWDDELDKEMSYRRHNYLKYIATLVDIDE